MPVRIREAQRGDFPAMARVRVDTWRSAYRGILSEELLARLSYDEVTARWQRAFWDERAPGVRAFVAESEEQEIVGIAVCGPEQTRDARYQGEVYVLYVLPSHQKQGTGRRLVQACVQHLLQELAATSMLIWVIAENPYRRFYESLEGRVVRQKLHVIGGQPILEVGYGWEDLSGLDRFLRQPN